MINPSPLIYNTADTDLLEPNAVRSPSMVVRILQKDNEFIPQHRRWFRWRNFEEGHKNSSVVRYTPDDAKDYIRHEIRRVRKANPKTIIIWKGKI